LELQLKSLNAFAPLFPITGKSRYAESVSRFLIKTCRNPFLQKKLQVAASINLTRENHYLAYDEALETFGVKFIKENLPGHVKNSENLKNLIKATQSERERLLILYDEYVDDISTSRNIRAVNDRNEALWKLVDELLETFNDSSPEKCPMFTEAKQLTTKGYQLMFSCYEKGIERLENIIKQDIDKTERKTPGRRKKDIIPQLPEDTSKRVEEIEDDAMNMELVEVSETSVQQPEISNQIEEEEATVPTTLNLILPDPIVMRRRVLSDEEKEILN
jgi:hypothetical protein